MVSKNFMNDVARRRDNRWIAREFHWYPPYIGRLWRCLKHEVKPLCWTFGMTWMKVAQNGQESIDHDLHCWRKVLNLRDHRPIWVYVYVLLWSQMATGMISALLKYILVTWHSEESNELWLKILVLLLISHASLANSLNHF